MKKIHYTESLNYEIERTARALKLMGVQIFNDLDVDITPDEYCTLDVISCNDDICQRDLAKYLLKDRANTGRILNTLEEKGLIVRNMDTRSNRLIKKIGLSGEGRAKLEEIDKMIEDYVSKINKPFDEAEIKKFVAAVKLFRRNLEKLLELKI